jgi:hypothetical protein
MSFAMYTVDAQQQALGFLLSQKAHIETTAIAIRYPEIQYTKLVPIDTSAAEWAKSVVFFSTDRVGKAEWYHHMAKDVPRADVVREKHEHGIEMAAIGYGYTLEELGQSAMVPGTNLNADRAAAARRAYEEFMDDVAIRGSETKGWTGLINDPNVTQGFVAFDGTTDSSDWDDKTADQILRDVNDFILGVYTDSATVEMADTLLLPISAHSALATRRLPETAITVLEFLMKYNVYTAQTQRPLTIMAVRGLETAGEDGTARMVAYRYDSSVLKLHLPMPHRFLPVWQDGPMQFEVPGIFRTGGLEIRRPGAVRYADGVINPAYD